ncbi:MAG: hypothetical protein WCD79_12410 [Chthoniobacteraceae bacterium]
MKSMSFHCNQSDVSAYILLEVMLATAIFAMAAVALAVLLNTAMGASTDLQRENKITWNLESKLTEAKINRLVVGKETLPPDAGGIAYDKEISPLDLKNYKNQYLAGLYSIKITARWREDGRDETQVSQTYVYQP